MRVLVCLSLRVQARLLLELPSLAQLPGENVRWVLPPACITAVHHAELAGGATTAWNNFCGVTSHTTHQALSGAHSPFIATHYTHQLRTLPLLQAGGCSAVCLCALLRPGG